MSALFAHLLRRQRALLLTVIVFLVVIESVFVHVLETFQEQEGGLQELLSALPSFIENMLRSQLGELTARSSLAAFFRDPALLVPMLAAVVLAASQVRADRESGLVDVYLARPLSRHRYLLTNLFATVLPAFVLPAAIVLGLGIGLSTATIDKAPPFLVYVASASCFVSLFLFFGTLTLWLSTGDARRATVTARVAGVGVLGLVLDVLGAMWPPAGTLRPFGPFFYFNPVGVLDALSDVNSNPAAALDGLLPTAEPLFAQPGPLASALVLLSFSALFTWLAFRRFEARDI